jgi:UDP-N-acetylmuramyl pentapeptide phosphotransferase/UDP-N-acetylglucosamine-1-phosphate transferase
MSNHGGAWLSGLLIPAAAGIICAGLILVLRPWLQQYALARPNARSSHEEPTAQGGGIAVIAATLAVATVAVGFRTPEFGALSPVLAATFLIAVLGAVDDIRPLDVVPRLVLQTLAVCAVIVALPAELRVVPILPWWLERGLLVLGGLWFVNLVNFMDGIDWMTVAQGVPMTAGVVLVGLGGGLPVPALAVALALLGALIGFAPFNRPVAKLFLGDVGSLPIGLLAGWLLVLLAGHGHLAAALILPLYYLADATITLGQRLYAGERVWEAHRSHFYQRATARGFTVFEVVARVFIVNVALVLLAAATVWRPSAITSLLALTLAGALVGWLLTSFARGRPKRGVR